MVQESDRQVCFYRSSYRAAWQGTVPDLYLLPFTCCCIFSLPGMQSIPLALQLVPSVCTERGRARKRQRRGGGRDWTTKMAHLWTWAFLLCQDSPCTNLRPFHSVTESTKCGFSEEIADAGGAAGGTGREGVLR